MRLQLTFACGQYDRVIALQDGSISPEGIDLNFVPMLPTELFRRQARHAEFDVAEFSLSTHAILADQGDRRLVGIPVFPSRRFRHSEFFVNTGAGIREPRDLIGKRMGVMEYQQTAAIWMRALLQHDYGVRPDQIEWYFGGYDKPENYTERVPIELPSGVHSTTIASHQSLDQLLDQGEIDALMGPTAPPSFLRGSPSVARLFPNHREAEIEFYRRTSIFPIMHMVVIKREVYEKAPWVAESLYKAFVAAKAEGRSRLRRSGHLYCSLPWLRVHLEETDALLGGDPFVYGLEENRKLLETFVDYSLEQGMIGRALTVDELFAPETHGSVDPRSP